MNENLLSFVLQNLDANKGQHKAIAAAAGVPYSTLMKISQRVTDNPGVKSVQLLADFFKRTA